jgi:hypothetical protein
LEEVDDLGLGLASTGLDPRLEIDPGIGIAVEKISTAISGLGSTKSWTELLFVLLLQGASTWSLTKTMKL